MENYTLAELKEKAFSVSPDEYYNVPLTEEDIERLKTELPTLLIELEGKEQEFKEYKKQTSDSIKGKKHQIKNIYHAVEFGEMNTSGSVYNLQNFKLNKMELYTAEGLYIGSRDFEEHELQTQI
jgi:hypothetical protein